MVRQFPNLTVEPHPENYWQFQPHIVTEVFVDEQGQQVMALELVAVYEHSAMFKMYVPKITKQILVDTLFLNDTVCAMQTPDGRPGITVTLREVDPVRQIAKVQLTSLATMNQVARYRGELQ